MRILKHVVLLAALSGILFVTLASAEPTGVRGQPSNRKVPVSTTDPAKDMATALRTAAMDAQPSSTKAQAPPPDNTTDGRVRAATQALSDKLRQLREVLKERPVKAAPDAWTDPIKASEELLAKTRQVMQLREDILRLTGEVNNAGGASRSELSKLREIFAGLKAQAEDEITGTDGSQPMPAQLLDAVKREIAALDRGVQACDGTIRWAAGVVSSHKEAVAVIQRAGPMLSRMEIAAESFNTLARLGQQLGELDASMKEFSVQLNACLEMLDGLAYSTERAVDQISPQPRPSQKGVVN